MPVLLTIGTSKKPLRRFIELLRGAGVDAVIDTRRNNTSQLAGYSKKEDLDFLLTEAFQIRYEHRPELALLHLDLAELEQREGNLEATREHLDACLPEFEAMGMRPARRQGLPGPRSTRS